MISLSTYDANDEVYRGVAAPPSPFPPSLTKTLETSVESPSKDGGKDKDLRSPTLRTVESLSDSRSTSVPDWESFSDLYSPPEEPEYENFVFNRTTIFFTDSPAGVANRLATCLHMPKRGWEVHTCPATFKIRAVCNTSPESVMVEVLFFRSSFEGTKATAMEVRRLEGDALAFSRVFCGLKEQVRKSGVLLGSQGKGKGGRVDERSAGCVAVCSGVGGVDSWDDLIAPPSLDSLSPPIPAL
uniref:Uncharacterized protein n=1 Tax=Chromera velia CCMP2878 TaxID=1169474 RepID=A0A0G4GCQ8_9ALVE|eukprot:Cvel_4520.t1-p1 / transcript=Cvel_4520.t1 / gene=Cvel_4520 / organism=Chromera_velia_CCMP2878 / gene_product=hypothetical protein / transcript_product=hypothetical protein / location=Cvel_scaffold198:13533-15976(+) / protein_length=241 / sequence_SO=supercontig / SO=protein_coding / is_pseudo=false